MNKGGLHERSSRDLISGEKGPTHTGRRKMNLSKPLKKSIPQTIRKKTKSKTERGRKNGTNRGRANRSMVPLKISVGRGGERERRKL